MSKGYRERQKAAGLCIHCPNKAAPGSAQCATHKKLDAAKYARTRRERRRYARRGYPLIPIPRPELVW